MASKAHAFFCFEVLTASFEGGHHIDLQTILDLYERSANKNVTHAIGNESEDGTLQPSLPSITRLQTDDSKSSSATSTPSNVSVNSSTSQLIDAPGTGIPVSPTYASRLLTQEAYPLFVTWNVLSKAGNKSLRGCIGTFEALPLEKGLAQYALTSAFEDTRFSPIPASQVPKLSCSLTLLADFEETDGPMDWELGTHGIRVSFTHRYRRHGATYLPDVAVEQGWSKEETLESLMRKAGWEPHSNYRGSSKPWEEFKDFRVVRYTGLKASASYSEWQDWRRTTELE